MHFFLQLCPISNLSVTTRVVLSPGQKGGTERMGPMIWERTSPYLLSNV
jgi:hypothetical protein